MSLARPTAPVWASTYHATVPSIIALPFERPMAIGRPVRGLRRARKSRGKVPHKRCPRGRPARISGRQHLLNDAIDEGALMSCDPDPVLARTVEQATECPASG